MNPINCEKITTKVELTGNGYNAGTSSDGKFFWQKQGCPVIHFCTDIKQILERLAG